jgi:hypothetical protein
MVSYIKNNLTQFELSPQNRADGALVDGVPLSGNFVAN